MAKMKPKPLNTQSHHSFNFWGLSSAGIALLLAIPVLVILSFSLIWESSVFGHLVDTVLSQYISNSLWLMIGVGIGTVLIGVSCAWLVAMYDFPGRSFFEWGLLLPLAMPAYIIAYTYTGMLDFAGPLQTAIRDYTGWGYGDYWFPEIRSLGGAIAMLTLVLYPYVYLLSRACFTSQSRSVLEVSRSLGHGTWATFYKVVLPLARPAVIAGLSLVLMETLADYGTVEYFGVQTFTTGIFRTWYGLDNAPAAAQLASILFLFTLVLIVLERHSRNQARFHNVGRDIRNQTRQKLAGLARLNASLLCFVVVGLGFVLPFGQLMSWTIATASTVINQQFIDLIMNSLLLAGTTAVIALLVAVLLGYGRRVSPTAVVKSSVRLAAMGYAIPGTVIAIGVIIPFGWLDNTLDTWLRAQFGVSSGLLLSGTLIALIFAYLVRFLAVSLHAVDTGLEKITHSMDEAAKSLGHSTWSILGKIHLPMLRGSLITAILLVFVDVLKELPATLILRPFNFDTLAVRAYEYASDERLADASSAAISIVLVGIIPVILLSRSLSQSRHE